MNFWRMISNISYRNILVCGLHDSWRQQRTKISVLLWQIWCRFWIWTRNFATFGFVVTRMVLLKFAGQFQLFLVGISWFVDCVIPEDSREMRLYCFCVKYCADSKLNSKISYILLCRYQRFFINYLMTIPGLSYKNFFVCGLCDS